MPKALQIKIILLDIKPQIRRRILIRNDFTLNDLHHVIQCVMPWENYHLFKFVVGCSEISSNKCNNKISSLKLAEKDSIAYLYDFGDCWLHKIFIEKITTIDPRQKYPFCIKAERACPPEDCGGIPGYLNMLNVIKDKNHSDYEDIMEWLDDDFDPEHVNLEEINKNLQETLIGEK